MYYNPNEEETLVMEPMEAMEPETSEVEAQPCVQDDMTNKIDMTAIECADRAVISLSGGMDSTMLLMSLLARGIKEVKALSFSYGQKHSVELKKVKKNIKFLQSKGFDIEHQVIDLTDVFSDSASSLKNGNGAIPEGNYKEENMKSTVVENRNVIFSAITYGKALGWANRTESNVLISLGVHAGDHFIYPDCRPESVEMAKELFRISNLNSDRVDYIAPFEYLDKGHVLVAGLKAMGELGFSKAEMKKVLKNTHTCYSPNEAGESCGKCGSCRERAEAFEFAKIYKEGRKTPYKWLKEDPIAYVNS